MIIFWKELSQLWGFSTLTYIVESYQDMLASGGGGVIKAVKAIYS